MDKKIEEAVRQCEACQINTKAVKLNPFKSSIMPIGSWRELAMDWYGPVYGKYVLILIDCFSRYPLHKIFRTTNAEVLNKYLDEIFLEYQIGKNLIMGLHLTLLVLKSFANQMV
jgi:hypothetical protein